jgi:hypothetical protein
MYRCEKEKEVKYFTNSALDSGQWAAPGFGRIFNARRMSPSIRFMGEWINPEGRHPVLMVNINFRLSAESQTLLR